MLGDRNVRGMIEKALDRLYEDLSVKIDKNNSDRIHAVEASYCTRLAYYERKDPLPPDNSSKVSILLSDGIRRALSNIHGEYKVDTLAIEVDADMVIGDEFVVHFKIVPELPKIPHPRDMLYLNACLFALGKGDGILIYMTAEGKTLEFSITKNNRMFEEVVRRARVLSTLQKDKKVPIIEPSDLCLSCKYYSRCYAREKIKEEEGGDIIADLFGKKKSK
jgi:CRISPR-associated exonuclease Cas4